MDSSNKDKQTKQRDLESYAEIEMEFMGGSVLEVTPEVTQESKPEPVLMPSVNTPSPKNQIGYRLGCDHYLEFYISDEIKSKISQHSANLKRGSNSDIGVCKQIGTSVYVSETQKIMFIYGQSRYYYDSKENCDLLLLDYTKNKFTTRLHISARVLIEKPDYVKSLDEIKTMLQKLHKKLKTTP